MWKKNQICYLQNQMILCNLSISQEGMNDVFEGVSADESFPFIYFRELPLYKKDWSC